MTMSTLGPDDLVLCGVPVAHVPLLNRLKPARNAAFAAISVGPPDIWALEAAGVSSRDIRARIADHGLAIAEMDCIGCWLPGHHAYEGAGEHVAALKSMTPERVIPLAASVGARSVSLIEMLGVTPSVDEAAEHFAHACDLAAEHNLLVHIEWLPWAGVPDLMSALRIVEAANRSNGGLTVDSWHFYRSPSTLEQLASIPGDKVFAVQLSDAPADAQTDLVAETMNARLSPGEGELDLVGLIRTLDRIGSTAPIGVEVFNADVRVQPIDQTARAWAQSTHAVLQSARRSP
jgi:sugar phosphate isomerase/epimerase